MQETIHEKLERERKAANPKAGDLRDFRAYARGIQRSTLTTAQQAILRGVVGRRFCDNVCKMVLAAASSRLQLVRLDVENEEVQKWLYSFWTLAGVALLSKQVHWAALRDGDHAVSLSWDGDKGAVRLSREKWWDGKTGIFISYDEQDRPVYAAKEWVTWDKKRRRVVWWPDRIERYVQQGDGWQPYYLEASDIASWQADWVDASGSTERPLGLPVVHFRNIYMPNDSSDEDADSSYGVSELDGGVLGLQDEINDIQRDITSGSRYTGYQMLYGTGIRLVQDASGVDIPPRVEPGAFFYDSNPAASYGTLPAGDLSQLERSLNIKLRAVSRMTATPLHQISNDWPSGDALEQADEPLVAKVSSMAQSFGPSWASLAHKATMLANAFGGMSLDTEAMITAVFAPAEKLNLNKRADYVSKVAPHLSDEEILKELGKGPDEIKGIIAQMQAKARRNAGLVAPSPGAGQEQERAGESDGEQ